MKVGRGEVIQIPEVERKRVVYRQIPQQHKYGVSLGLVAHVEDYKVARCAQYYQT